MKKVCCGVVLAFIVALIFCGTVFADDASGKIVYYDTAELTCGSFVLPAKYDTHRFFGELRDAEDVLVARISNEEFTTSFTDATTELSFNKSEQWTYGAYKFTILVEANDFSSTKTYTVPVDYVGVKPKTGFEQVPVGQTQYRLFLQDFLVEDDAHIEVSMLNENNEMVATTYLDFSSENLVGSMLNKTASEFEGYSYLEMVTLFQTGAIPEGTYQLFFNID